MFCIFVINYIYMKTYIYILQDPSTDEVRYVGKSKNPHRRYLSHLWQKPKVKYHSYYWIQKLLKNGIKPILTIIDETEGDWIWLEQYWIEQFKQWGANLTNITSGGDGACNAAKWNNKVVSCFDINGNYVETFESIKSAANKYNISHGHIISALKGKLILCKNLQWRYGSDTDSISPIVIYGNMTKHLKIAQYDLNDNLVKVFESIRDVSLQLNIKNTVNIYQCINNKRKTANGYKWKLYTESIL